MKNIHSKPLLCSLVVAALVAVAGCQKSEITEKPQTPPTVSGQTVNFPDNSEQVKVFKTVKTVREATDQLQLPGRLMLDEQRTARVYAAFASRVEKVLVEWGQQVTAGQALAAISAPDIGSTQSDLARAKADQEQAQQTYERNKQLFDAGVIAQKDLQSAAADLARSKAELSRLAAKSQAYRTGGNVNQNGTLFSPIAGRVIERNVNPGTEVRPDNNQPGVPALFVISDPRQLTAVLDLPETELGRVKTGQSMQLTSVAYPDQTFQATIDIIQDQIDPSSRTVKLRARVSNPDLKLKAEQFVSAQLSVPASEGFLVPNEAVLLIGQQQVVFVQKSPTQYEKRVVKARASSFGKTRVLSGLNDGETVVTEGGLFLQQIMAQTKAS